MRNILLIKTFTSVLIVENLWELICGSKGNVCLANKIQKTEKHPKQRT